MKESHSNIVNYQYDELVSMNDYIDPLDISVENFTVSVPPVNADYTLFEQPNNIIVFQQPSELIQDESESNQDISTKEKIKQNKYKYTERFKIIKKDTIEDKKQEVILRNRLAAQKSRDRKKLEFFELKSEKELLVKEKQSLEEKLSSVTSELEQMKSAVEQLSSESKKEFDEIMAKQTQENSWHGKPSKCRPSVLLAGALLGCICIICCISPFIIIEKSTSQNRILLDSEFEYLSEQNRSSLIELK